MIDIELKDNYDIVIDFKNGDFKLIDDTLNNEINVSLLTDELDSDFEGFKLGGFINEDIGNKIWILVNQNAFLPQIRAELKEEVRTSLIDYGNIEFTTINSKDIKLELKLDNNMIIRRSINFE